MNYWTRRAQEQQQGTPARPARTTPPVQPRPYTPPAQVAPPPPPDPVCPECGSVNYGGPNGSTVPHCFDCGAGARYRNSTQGMPTVQSDGPVKKAKQVESAGFQPTTVIGRLG